MKKIINFFKTIIDAIKYSPSWFDDAEYYNRKTYKDYRKGFYKKFYNDE